MGRQRQKVAQRKKESNFKKNLMYSAIVIILASLATAEIISAEIFSELLIFLMFMYKA